MNGAMDSEARFRDGAIADFLPGPAIPLLLLPGTLCDQRVFGPLLSHLDTATRTILHGGLYARSPGEAAAAMLAAFPGPLAVLGFSLGGIVALEMARQAPARIAGLALVNSTAGTVPVCTHQSRRAAVAAAEQDGIVRFTETTLLPTYFATPAARDRHRPTIVAMAAEGGTTRFADQTELALTRTDAHDRLGSLTMPVLVVGGAEDAINPPNAQKAIAQGLPDATLAIIPDSGHFTPLEQPARLASHVADWLDRVDQARSHDQEEWR